ncbi:MAG: hypothetical protein M1833_003929 [Piccolia ochrophora]|nr:MAG: hypothetical protein M1833_003929 [Piccolia ochrophora]
MANPLSPLSPSDLNLKTGLLEAHLDDNGENLFDYASPSKYDHTTEADFDIFDTGNPPSSPFVTDLPVCDTVQFHRGSPRKHTSPTRTSPVKNENVSSPAKLRSPTNPMSAESPAPLFPLPSPLRDNEGLTTAINMMEEEQEITEDDDELENSSITIGDESDHGGFDDTAFSTFSAIPNLDMTTFARQTPNFNETINSPAKQLRMETYRYYDHTQTPSPRGPISTPGTVRRRPDEDRSASPSPTPRQRHGMGQTDTTDLIMDFTEQFNALSSCSSFSYISPTKRGRTSPTKPFTQPDLAGLSGRGITPSPSKHALPPPTPTERRALANLLDFDIPPPPTPRSVPTISARELESLKSGYLSQISSLKATLSGKEAEVTSLKEAVGDAERRVGISQEKLREEQGAKEALQSDKDDWERRGREMETVLRSVKEEIMLGETEMEKMKSKLEESERKREEADTKAAEAESQVAGMRAGSGSNSDSSGGPSKDVQVAVERVARELHALYKTKHESKVGALKKSYETRWEAKLSDLETKLEETIKENEDLRHAKDATLSGVIPPLSISSDTTAHRLALDTLKAESEEHKAKLLGLTEELASLTRDKDHLLRELEKERVEKGELVAAVEEMLAVSTAAGAGDPVARNEVENSFRSSISRASGLRGPGFMGNANGGGVAESRIGRVGVGPAPNGAGSGSSAPVSSRGNSAPNAIGRSGIMNNIERMGRPRGP